MAGFEVIIYGRFWVITEGKRRALSLTNASGISPRFRGSLSKRSIFHFAATVAT
jgi:hypothetical protein